MIEDSRLSTLLSTLSTRHLMGPTLPPRGIWAYSPEWYHWPRLSSTVSWVSHVRVGHVEKYLTVWRLRHIELVQECSPFALAPSVLPHLDWSISLFAFFRLTLSDALWPHSSAFPNKFHLWVDFLCCSRESHVFIVFLPSSSLLSFWLLDFRRHDTSVNAGLGLRLSFFVIRAAGVLPSVVPHAADVLSISGTNDSSSVTSASTS